MYASTRSLPAPEDPVSRVMMWPVATVPAEASLIEVAEALAADEIGVLLVLEGGRLAGLVSERDVVEHLAAGATPEHLLAGEVMTTEPITVTSGTSLVEAGLLMRDAGVRHLPVVDPEGLAGVVSMRDLFGVLVEHATGSDVVVVPSGTRVVVRRD